MPLIRTEPARAKPCDYRRGVGEDGYDAMRTTLNMPEDDRFQIINEHPAENLSIAPGYLGIARTADCILIQITLNDGRTVEQKKAFYKAVADGLQQRVKLRREDVFISLVEVRKENWSFGNGEAQYAK